MNRNEKRIKNFFSMNEKLQRIVDLVLNGKNQKEGDKYIFSLCLTELYFRMKEIRRYVNSISKQKDDFITREKDLDHLMGILVMVKIEIYDEMIDWMKKLKRPLAQIISEIEKELEKREKERKKNKKNEKAKFLKK